MQPLLRLSMLARVALACALLVAAMNAFDAFDAFGAECVSDYEREQAWEAQVVPQLVVGDAVHFEGRCAKPFWGIYTQPAGARRVVLLAHGMGVHPDYGLTHALRIALADAGFATLAIQMPVLPISVGPYAYEALVMDEARRRLEVGVRWLEAKGYRGHIALVSHGLGSRMANLYAADSGSSLSAWVAISMMALYERLDQVRIPVLDLYAEHDSPEVLERAAARRAAVAGLPTARQTVIQAAGHEFEAREKEVARVVREFLDAVEPAR